MSIADKIQRLSAAKENISDAITAQGGTVAEGDGFEEFASDIGTIQTGGDLESFIAGTSTSVTYEGEIVRDCAFAGMSELEEVNLPNATYIGLNAFYTGYVNKYISDPSEGDLTFNNNKLTTVNIPKVTNILADAFQECRGLTSIDLPDTLIRIGMYAFAKSGLQTISIPSSVLYIHMGVFSKCNALTDVEIDCSLEYCDSELFRNCNNLRTVLLSNNVVKIPSAFCADCIVLTNIKIPSTVTYIGGDAFSGCTSLASIKIPDSVARIGNFAFRNCSSLITIDLTEFNSTNIPIFDGGVYADPFSNINSNARFYFSDSATLQAFSQVQSWNRYTSKFTTDPVPTPSEE